MRRRLRLFIRRYTHRLNAMARSTSAQTTPMLMPKVVAGVPRQGMQSSVTDRKYSSCCEVNEWGEAWCA